MKSIKKRNTKKKRGNRKLLISTAVDKYCDRFIIFFLWEEFIFSIQRLFNIKLSLFLSFSAKERRVGS